MLFLFFLIPLTGFFVIYPLYKKRPVIIKESGLIIYFFVLLMTLFSSVELWTYIAGIVVVPFLYLLKPWFVYGVTSVMLSEALEKAALATRAPIEKLADGYKIDGSVRVEQHNFAEKITFVLFRATSESKKAKLTRVVFKKFVQNYFI